MLRILLLEDNAVDSEAIVKVLLKRFADSSIDVVCSLHEGLQTASDGDYDVILSDLSLPDCDGLEAVVKLVRENPASPLIVLTGVESAEVSVQAIADGAQDYLVKGRLTPDLLERTINHSIQRHNLFRRNGELLNSYQESRWMLEKKNRKLEKLYRITRDFLESVSAELRDPLSELVEQVSKLREPNPFASEQPHDRLVQRIGDRINDLQLLVDDMTDISVMESGLLHVARCQCDIREIFAQVLPKITRKVEAGGVKVECNVSRSLPLLFCDGEKAARVLLNLAVDAAKVSPPAVKLHLAANAGSEGDVVVDVLAEQAIEEGSDPANIETCVEPVAEASGIAVGIARELVDLNLGQFTVEHRIAESTDEIAGKSQYRGFRFTIPMNQPVQIARRLIDRLASDPDSIPSMSLIKLSMSDDVSEQDAWAMYQFLLGFLRQNDLIFPVRRNQFLLLISIPTVERQAFFDRLADRHGERNHAAAEVKLPGYETINIGTWNLADRDEEIFECMMVYLDDFQHQPWAFARGHSVASGRCEATVVETS
jgi:CheY-like chemotaxis protein